MQVTGDTVYNMLRLAEVECDSEERPLNPHKIRTAEVCSLFIYSLLTTFRGCFLGSDKPFFFFPRCFIPPLMTSYPVN